MTKIKAKLLSSEPAINASSPERYTIITGLEAYETKCWICFPAKSQVELEATLIAQHFASLLLEGQPEALFAKGPSGRQYLLVERVPQHQLAWPEVAENLRGIAALCITALFLGDSQFKPETLHQQPDGTLLKPIWNAVFHKLSDMAELTRITTETLCCLPRVDLSHQRDWLDLINNQQYQNSAIDMDALQRQPWFQEELHRCLLKICLLQDAVIHKECERFSSEKKYSTYLQLRRQEIKQAAMKLGSFQDYLLQFKTDPRALLPKLAANDIARPWLFRKPKNTALALKLDDLKRCCSPSPRDRLASTDSPSSATVTGSDRDETDSRQRAQSAFF